MTVSKCYIIINVSPLDLYMSDQILCLIYCLLCYPMRELLSVWVLSSTYNFFSPVFVTYLVINIECYEEWILKICIFTIQDLWCLTFIPHTASPGRGQSSHHRRGPGHRTCTWPMKRESNKYQHFSWCDSYHDSWAETPMRCHVDQWFIFQLLLGTDLPTLVVMVHYSTPLCS